MRQWIRQADWAGPDEVRYAATISVWVRWFLWAAATVESVYRPPDAFAAFAALLLVLGALNAGLHYKLIRKRSIPPNLVLGIGVMDVVAITTAVVVHGGFDSFIYLGYFPAVAGFAVLAGSTVLVLAWCTSVAVTYAAVCLTVGSGLDVDAGDEKVLFWRIATLYAVVAAVTMITRFERTLRRDAVQRERTLQRERIELSQAIHDTTAQTAYMIGLGIDTAIDLAGESSPELSETLAATSTLSKSAMWDLRRPIDMGHIFEGRELGPVLRSHIETFTTITSLPTDMRQLGAEPALSTETRTRLFSIAHNALTNAFRHARASRVEVVLGFAADQIELSISDDGGGLPDGYAERGHGFPGMQVDAERLGGALIVESGGREQGTTVTCRVPYGNQE